MAKRIKVMPVQRNKDIKNSKIRSNGYRRPNKMHDFKLTEDQKAEAIKLFDMARNILANTTLDIDINSNKLLNIAYRILGNIEFDVDAGSRPLEQAVHASNMRGGIQKYLKL